MQESNWSFSRVHRYLRVHCCCVHMHFWVHIWCHRLDIWQYVPPFVFWYVRDLTQACYSQPVICGCITGICDCLGGIFCCQPCGCHSRRYSTIGLLTYIAWLTKFIQTSCHILGHMNSRMYFTLSSISCRNWKLSSKYVIIANSHVSHVSSTIPLMILVCCVEHLTILLVNI